MSETPFYPQLFTEGSPLLTAPKQLQDFFRQPKTNPNQLPLKHPFQPKVMAKPKCTKILAIGQKYFLCKQCSFDQNIDKMAFCSSCFILQLHQGHNFQQKFASQKTGFVSCDCGRSIRIKKQKMCKIHKNGDSDLELKEEDMQKFNQFFLPLFRILIFLENKGQQNLQPLVKSISKLLTSLCKDSFYYCSLTIKLFKNEVTINETSYRLLRKLFDYKQFCQLLLQLIADDKFLLQLGEEFMKIQNEGHFLIFQFNRLRRQILDSQSFLLKMAEKKIFFINELSNYFIIASQMSTQSEKQKLIGQFINSLAQKIDTVEYIDMICNILKQEGYDFLSSEKFLNNILSGILTHLKKQKQTAKIQQKKEQGQEQKKDEKKQITAEQKSVLKKSISILSKIIQKKSKKDIRRYSKALNELVSESKEMESLLQILAENCLKAQIFNQFSSERYREAFLVMLLIIDQFTDKKEKRSQFLTAIWKGIIQSDKPFYENLENIYGIISFLATSYRTFPILGLDEEVYDKISSKQQRQNLFKSYLFQKKEISKKELWSERQKGWLKFENCGKILKELCEYNDAHQNFVYKSKMSYPNGCIRVPVQLSKNWENVRTINLSYNSPPFTNSKTLLNFLLILFKGQEFYKIFSTAFVEGMESVQKQPRNLQRWKTRAVGQNYIIILLLIDKLCNGQEHPEIKEEIQKIKHNKEEYRFRFTEIGSQQRIKNLLCIQSIAQQAEKVEETEIKQQQKTQQQLKKEQMIKKSQQKRQKMLNKMKEKQNKMLDKMKNQKSSVYEQQEDNFCLSCKEREKKDNQFVNLIHLSKGNTVSQILHADESKTHMKILTNLHTIHLNCFKDVKKKNMEFPCPLCKQNVNCFLPYRPNRASKQTMNICWNVMNAALVSIYNVYETGCLFQVLLISLLQSLTFTQLLSARKSKSIVKIKNKSDLYLIDILSCVYSLSSEAQKTSYRAVYNKIRQNIKTCTKKQLQMFQMVILEAIFFRISGQTDINYSLVENLSKIMIEEELQTLKNTLIFITEGNPDLISSFDDLSLSKISEHSYYQSPDKKKQEPTSLQHIQQHQIKQVQTSLQKEISIQTQTFSAEKFVQTDPQRKTLGISIWTPPKKFTCFNTKQFLSTLTSSPRCGCESENIQSVCLICRRLFCDKCEQDKYHEQIHMNNFILLNMQNLKMMTKKNGKNEKHDVYYNEFMIQYKKMDEDGSDSELDVDDPLNVFATKKGSSEDQGLFKYEYCLNSNKFNEQVEKFYNIIG